MYLTFSLVADDGQPRMNIFHHTCALKMDEGPCKALREKFYFNIDTGSCESFDYGGCQGNGNNFESLEECEEMCIVNGELFFFCRHASVKYTIYIQYICIYVYVCML